MSDTILISCVHRWKENPSLTIVTYKNEAIDKWWWVVYQDECRIQQEWYFHTAGGARDDALSYLEANYGAEQ